MKMKWKTERNLYPYLSAFFVILGLVLLSIHKWIIDVIMDRILILQPHKSDYFFNEWKNPRQPLDLEVYFFNWSNPEDLMDHSVKPSFREVGPIVLKKVNRKWNVTFNANNTITYRNMNIFYFNEKKSKIKMSDNVTSLSIVPVLASDQSRDWNFVFKKALSVALYNKDLHVTNTVGEWLLDGYKDTLLSTAGYLPIYSYLPDKVAWFYKRNASASYDGVFNIGTGLGNTTLGLTYRWNYKNRSDYTGHCGDFQASQELYPQFIKKDKIEFFFSDLCRKIVFDYNSTIDFKGLEAYKFVGGLNLLDNGKYDKRNECFCHRKCREFGVIDYSKCKYNMPAYISLPHFNLAHPKYRKEIEGMDPKGDDPKHNIEIILFPRTGTILSMTFGVQVNMYIEPNPEISRFANIPERIIPLFWFHADYKIDTWNTIILHLVYRVPFVLRCISYMFIVIGAALCTRCIYHHHIKKARQINVDNRQLENLNLLIQKEYNETPAKTYQSPNIKCNEKRNLHFNEKTTFLQVT